MEAAHCERWSTAEDRTRHQNIWRQQLGEEIMTEHCEDRTCSGGPVTAEPDEHSRPRPCTSLDPSQEAVGAVQQAQGHRTPSDPVSQNLDLQVHDTESSAMSVCKQPLQLQLSGTITTVCRGSSAGEGGASPPKSRCSCISPSKTDHRRTPPCDQAICCGSYVHNTNFYHTLAAYCHPNPIPAPAPLLPRLAGMEPPCTTLRVMAPPAASTHLSLPRLMSSISETGLDSKHLLQCCNLNCTWSSTPPLGPMPLGPLLPGPPPPGPPPPGLPPPGPTPPCQQSRECCRSPAGAPIWSLDKGTMTTTTVLRDVGVQTGQTGQTSHVFPHICLADDSRSSTSAAKTPKSDRNKKQGGTLKSPVKEVKWDAEGMTWEVYGASVDPEELGLAIQKHLELQIKETASRAAKLARQDTNTSQQTGHKRSRLVDSFRGPGCCSRRTTAKD